MASEEHSAILRRIAGSATEGGEGGTIGETHDRTADPAAAALRLEAARAAREAFGLTAIIESCEVLSPTLHQLEAEVQPGALSVLMVGPHGRLGLAVYAPELALSLLEWRLLGILADEAPPNRPCTGTDAAVLADLLDPLLTRFGTSFGEDSGADWAIGYHQSRRIEDPRHVPLTLTNGAYHGFRIGLKLGEGARGGKLFLAFPAMRESDGGGKSTCRKGPTWAQALQGGVLGTELSVTAVLWRTRLNAAQASALRLGDKLSLPPGALDTVRLEGPGRVFVAAGRLGQCRGDRAVKVEAAGAEAGLTKAMASLAPMAEPGLALPEAEAPLAMMDMPGMDAAAPLATEDEAGFPMAELSALGDLPQPEDEEAEPFDFAAAALAPLEDLPEET